MDISGTYLDVQPNVPNLECSAPPDIDAHEVGRVFVQYVDVAQPVEEQLPADGARERREESHGGGEAGDRVGGRAGGRLVERLSTGEKRLHG